MVKRKHRIYVRLNESEFNRLTEKVEASGLSREEFIRRTLANKKIHESAPVDFSKWIIETRRVGQNISSILALARAKGFIDIPNLNQAIDELDDIENRLWNEFYPLENES